MTQDLVRHDVLCKFSASWRTGCPSWRTLNVVQSRSWTWSVFMVRHDAAYCASWRTVWIPSVMTDYFVRHDESCTKTLWNWKQNGFALSVVTLSGASWRIITVRHDALFVRHDDRSWICLWNSRQNSFALSVVTHSRASWRTVGLRRDAKLCVMTESFESPCFCIVRHDGGFLASWRTSQFFKNAQ